ncbi:hypothetical protein EC991_006367 [Linnemannia zychae]|nr:hypothetical protein EC991_006367 [Linnemannia zychae]
MSGKRTRISARLQPVAAALASAPGSASISTVLASISGSSSPVIRPTVIATNNTPPLPQTSPTPHRLTITETAIAPSEEEPVTTLPPPDMPLPLEDATRSVQEGVNDMENQINSEVEPPSTALPTAVLFSATEPTSVSSSNKGIHYSDYNFGSETVSTSTDEAVATLDQPGSSTERMVSEDMASTMTADMAVDFSPSEQVPFRITVDTTMEPVSLEEKETPSTITVGATTVDQTTVDETMDLLPLDDGSGDVWTGRAPSPEDNLPAQVNIVTLPSSLPSPPPQPQPPSTATQPSIGITPPSDPIHVIDLTEDTDASNDLEAMGTCTQITANDTSLASGSSPHAGRSGQAGQSKPSSKPLPLTVRLRLQAAEALERRKRAQSSSSTAESTPPIQGTPHITLSPTRSPQAPSLPPSSPVVPRIQQEDEIMTETQQQERQKLLSNRATNPLDLHEIRSNIARFLTRRDLRSCILVSEGWWQSFHPALWKDLRPVYKNVLGGMHDYPSAREMHKNCHLIRTFEYNGHGMVLTSMVPSVHSNYKNGKLEWRKSRAKEEAEESRAYIDEDVATDEAMGMDLDENLADFERRIESKRNERLGQRIQMQDIIAANWRQNEVSRHLNDDTDYSEKYCQQLERLILTEKRFSRDWGCHYRYWLRLISLNSKTLYALELHHAIRSLEALRDLYTTMFALGNLRELVLVDNDIDAQRSKVLLEIVCPRLRKLELKKMRIELGPFHNQVAAPTDCVIVPMPQMKSLTMNQVHTRSTAFGLDFIKMCPNLVELDFRPQWGMVVKTFTETLAEKLPKLTHLSFKMQGLSDLEVSSMIKAVPVLQKLDISGCIFGMMAANNLTTRHLLSITYLDIRSCTQVTGMLIQRVLGECRSLKTFMTDLIKAKDIVNNSVYPDWACVGLRELTMDIRGCPQDRELALKVYQQLAALKCLEYLDISRAIPAEIGPPDTEGNSNILTLGLDQGLKMLRPLRHLHTVIFRGISDNDFGLVELQWMVLAWPRLGNLGGKLITRRSIRYNPGLYPYTAKATPESAPSVTFSSSGEGSTFTSGTDSRPSARSGDPGPSTTTSTAAATATPSSATSGNSNVSNQAERGSAASADDTQSAKKTLSEAPAGHLSITLRKLNLHRKIQVVPHSEDHISPAARKKRKFLLLGDSSDEELERERDRPRFAQLDPRYRPEFRG